MNWEILETERMYLRVLTPQTYNAIFDRHSDSEIASLLFINDDETLQKEKEKFGKGLSTHNKSFVNFQMIGKSDATLVGLCGFHTWYVDHARAEIGYHIDKDELKGKGLMTEALQAILKYGFETMQLNRVEAMLSPANVASLKLLQKFGFVNEGLLRSHYQKNGQYEDSMVCSLLKPEFRL